MTSNALREVVVRRVRLREDLKPVNIYWLSGQVQPDWLFITQVLGPARHESFELQGITLSFALCQSNRGEAFLVGNVSCETLQSAKEQAHAEFGVEYVEWELCNVEITNPDESVDWARALPCSEPIGGA